MNGNVIRETIKIFEKMANWEVKLFGDFDGNGAVDMLFESLPDEQTGVIYLMKNRLADGSAGVKSIAVSYRKSDTNWKIVRAGDYNGDGKTDILWENSGTGKGMVWLMDGVSPSASSIIYTLKDTNPATKWTVVKHDRNQDFNNDGKTDLLWQKGDTKKVLVYVMNGFSYTFGAVYNNGTSWELLLK